MYAIVTPDSFLRRSRKFFRKHPDLKPRFRELLENLRCDPFKPGLGLHALTGRLEGLYAVRLTYQYRIIITFQITEKAIVLLDIGTHDDVYR